MNIEEARKLRPRDIVAFPADRGEPAGRGEVVKVDKSRESATHLGDKYFWVGVRHNDASPVYTDYWSSLRLQRTGLKVLD